MDGTDLSCVMDADRCVAYAVCLADHSLSLVPSDGPGDDEGRVEEMTVMHMAQPLAVVWNEGGLELASLMHSTSHFAKPGTVCAAEADVGRCQLRSLTGCRPACTLLWLSGLVFNA